MADAEFGEDIFDDCRMYYLAKGMAKAVDLKIGGFADWKVGRKKRNHQPKKALF